MDGRGTGAGLKEAIKCLVDESPGRLPPPPWPVNVYGGGLGRAGQGTGTVPTRHCHWGTRHPYRHCHLMGVQAKEMPPWCLLTFRRQTWLVASCEEEEEEGCWHSITDLSMLGSSLIHALETPVTSWPRPLPLLGCPQP